MPVSERPPGSVRGSLRLALCLLAVLSAGGCAEAPQRPPEMATSYNACVAGCTAVQTRPVVSMPVSRDPRDAMLAVMVQAFVARDQLAPMAQCVRECGAVPVAFERTVQVVHQTNAATISSIGKMAQIPLSIAAGGWAAARIADAGGQTEVNNTASGGSTAAGRNVADDHTAPIDITAGSIGSNGDQSPVDPVLF